MISLVLLLALNSYGPEKHELKNSIEWKQELVLLEGVNLKSYTPLSKRQVMRLRLIFLKTSGEFGLRNGLESCKGEQLEIRLVGQKQLNSRKYFHYIDRNFIVFGKYYKVSNILYITPESFKDTIIFEHEILHYMFDDCGPELSPEEEHEKIESYFDE